MSRRVSSAPGPRVTASADRCDHDMLHCVKHGTAVPGHVDGRNRHWPHVSEPRYDRAWLSASASRADRRAAHRTAHAYRGARRRAQWQGHPLGLPTDHGRTLHPVQPPSEHALRHREARDARRRERATRSTRAQRLADFRRVTPGASRSDFERYERDRKRMLRRQAAA